MVAGSMNLRSSFYKSPTEGINYATRA